MIDLNEMTIFMCVVETGSFVKAAKKLSLPSTTVSRKVQQLETVLGVRLLNRSTRKLSLTHLGEQYYQNIRPSLEAIENANQLLQQNQKNPHGLIRLTAPFNFSVYYLQSLIENFQEEYPNIHIDLIVNDNPLDLIDHNIDIAFRSGTLSTPTLIARKLFRKKIVYCASPDYVKNHGIPQIPDDLIYHNCILWRQSEQKQFWKFAYPDGLKEHVVHGRFSSDNTHLHICAALRGKGIAQLPEGLVQSQIQQGKLIAILSEYTYEAGNMYMVYPSHRLLPNSTRLFIDYLLAYPCPIEPLF
jgi:DNA-binding transcriptional LysR family regulator